MALMACKSYKYTRSRSTCTVQGAGIPEKQASALEQQAGLLARAHRERPQLRALLRHTGLRPLAARGSQRSSSSSRAAAGGDGAGPPHGATAAVAIATRAVAAAAAAAIWSTADAAAIARALAAATAVALAT